jgi:hypothetical protein
MRKILILLVFIFFFHLEPVTAQNGGLDLEYFATIQKSSDKVNIKVIVDKVASNYLILGYDAHGFRLSDYISDVIAVDDEGKLLQVIARENGWRVNTQGKKRIVFEYNISKEIYFKQRGVVLVKDFGAYIWNRFFFITPQQIEVSSIKLNYNVPKNWSVITIFDQINQTQFEVRKFSRSLNHDLLDSIVHMGEVEFILKKDCGNLSLSFVQFEPTHYTPSGTMYPYLRQEYNTAPKEEAELYLWVTCETWKEMEKIFGEIYLDRYPVVDVKVGNFNPKGWHSWLQTWERDMYPEIPHHVMHAYIFWHKNSPLILFGQKFRWCQEGIPVFYGHKMTYNLTGREIFLGEIFESYIVYDKARAIGRLNYNTIYTYNYGEMKAHYIDKRIRELTHGEKSLDDFLRYMYEKHGKTFESVSDDEMIAALNAITGHDLSAEYRRYILNDEPLPLDDINQYEDEFLEYVDYYSRKYLRGSKAMYFVHFELVMHKADPHWHTNMVWPNQQLLEEFKTYIKQGYDVSKITEKEVIEALNAITNGDSSDFFEYYTFMGEKPSVEQIRRYLMGETIAPPITAPKPPMPTPMPTAITTPAPTTLPPITTTPPQTTAPPVSEEPKGILQKIIVFLKKLFGWE